MITFIDDTRIHHPGRDRPKIVLIALCSAGFTARAPAAGPLFSRLRPGRKRFPVLVYDRLFLRHQKASQRYSPEQNCWHRLCKLREREQWLIRFKVIYPKFAQTRARTLTLSSDPCNHNNGRVNSRQTRVYRSSITSCIV